VQARGISGGRLASRGKRLGLFAALDRLR